MRRRKGSSRKKKKWKTGEGRGVGGGGGGKEARRRSIMCNTFWFRINSYTASLASDTIVNSVLYALQVNNFLTIIIDHHDTSRVVLP